VMRRAVAQHLSTVAREQETDGRTLAGATLPRPVSGSLRTGRQPGPTARTSPRADIACFSRPLFLTTARASNGRAVGNPGQARRGCVNRSFCRGAVPYQRPKLEGPTSNVCRGTVAPRKRRKCVPIEARAEPSARAHQAGSTQRIAPDERRTVGVAPAKRPAP
jgi:hypothetical protein